MPPWLLAYRVAEETSADMPRWLAQGVVLLNLAAEVDGTGTQLHACGWIWQLSTGQIGVRSATPLDSSARLQPTGTRSMVHPGMVETWTFTLEFHRRTRSLQVERAVVRTNATAAGEAVV
jgi:hypothetical protein